MARSHEQPLTLVLREVFVNNPHGGYTTRTATRSHELNVDQTGVAPARLALAGEKDTPESLARRPIAEKGLP
jgi:hypothetical protein